MLRTPEFEHDPAVLPTWMLIRSTDRKRTSAAAAHQRLRIRLPDRPEPASVPPHLTNTTREAYTAQHVHVHVHVEALADSDECCIVSAGRVALFAAWACGSGPSCCLMIVRWKFGFYYVGVIAFECFGLLDVLFGCVFVTDNVVLCCVGV